MERVSEPGPEAPARGDALLLGLLLLPLVVLAWPGATPIAADPATPELTGTGIAALATLPLGLWLAWKRPLPVRGYLLLFVALLVPANFGAPTDALETDRAVMTFLVAILVATGAGALGSEGKRRLVQGLVLTSGALLVPALLEGAPAWGGVLGNSGELSNAALPGALAGLVLWARGRDGWQWPGMVASSLFLLHAFFAPSIAGLLVMAATAGTLALLARPAPLQYRVRCLATAAIALGGLVLPGRGLVRTAPLEPVTAAGTTVPADLGGVEVRLRVWRATLDLVLENPLLGVGPGQFAVRFPAHRDAEERELSTWGYRVENTTEVEHPHNDWLLPWAEGGVVAGLCWWAFLAGVLIAALRTLRGAGQGAAQPELLTARDALAAGALGALAAALLNGPLLYGPLASVASFLAIGGLRGDARRRRDHPGDRLAGVLTPGLVLLLLFHAPRALELWRHGEALGEATAGRSATARRLAVERALEACPGSPTALALDARLRQQEDGDLEAALLRWREVLARRPLRFEARHQEGVLLARLGRADEARAAFERAAALDPREPRLRRNRARLDALHGRLESALEAIGGLEDEGRVDAVWIRDLAAEAALEGDVAAALALFARADPRFADLSGDLAWAFEQEYRQAGSPHAADGLRALAQLLWARQHAESGAWGDARRSYFQALRTQRGPGRPGGALPTRLEFAAALALEGRRGEAEQELEGLDLADVNWLALPEWSRQPLFALGAESLSADHGD